MSTLKCHFFYHSRLFCKRICMKKYPMIKPVAKDIMSSPPADGG